MLKDTFIISAERLGDLELILENILFPVTKAEIIRKAEVKTVPLDMLVLLRNLPSRFYRSKSELVAQCVCKSLTIRRNLLSSWNVDLPEGSKGGENGD
jgi:hypothetical protein